MDIWRLPYAARKELWDAVGYRPSAEQLKAHLDPHRLKLVSGGERAGKSFWTAHEMATWLSLLSDKDLIWLVGPTFELARPEVQHLIEQYGKIGLINLNTAQMPSNGQWNLWSARGTKIETKSSADVRRLAGVAPSGIAMTEAAQSDWDTFIRCRNRVAQKRGPLIMSGTQEGSRSWYADMFYEWEVPNRELNMGKSFCLPTWSNLNQFPGGRQDPEILALEAMLPADLFMERFGGHPCKPSNLVFREFDSRLHVPESGCPYDPALPVQIWVDPGYAGAYAVLAVQSHGREWWIVDEVYKQGWICQDVIDECKQRPWWDNLGFGVIDVAGRQHAGQESQIETWLRYGGIRLYSQMIPILPGIERLRTYLRDPASGMPLLFIDSHCVNLIREFGLYQYPKSQEHRHETEMPIQKDNHAISATIYGLVCNVGLIDRPALGRVSIMFKRG